MSKTNLCNDRLNNFQSIIAVALSRRKHDRQILPQLGMHETSAPTLQININYLPHSANYGNTFLLKKIFFERYGIRSIDMQKTIKYLKIQQSSRSENIIEYCLSINEYFTTFLLSRSIFHKHEMKIIVELAKPSNCLFKRHFTGTFFVQWQCQGH